MGQLMGLAWSQDEGHRASSPSAITHALVP